LPRGKPQVPLPYLNSLLESHGNEYLLITGLESLRYTSAGTPQSLKACPDSDNFHLTFLVPGLYIILLGLLPIEWVKREKTTPSHRPRGESRPGRDSLGGKNRGSGALARLPQGTGPRTLRLKRNPSLNSDNPIHFRRDPMEEPLPQDVLPRAGCRPGPGQLSSGKGRPGKLKIFLKHPLNWEKTHTFLEVRGNG
jgi:hypothetical protein